MQIAAGGYSSYFLSKDSTVWACGYNGYGQLGVGNWSFDTIKSVHLALTKIIQVKAGYYHVVFLKNDGTVWTAGRNDYGELGNGNNSDKNTPVQVSGLSNIIKIQCGGRHILFLKSDSTVWACGLNSDGQLGDGTNTNSNVPVRVLGLTGVKEMAADYYSSFFLKADGTVWATGDNIYGQLGIGTTRDTNRVVQIPTLSGVVSISGGNYHAAFVKNDHTIWATGRNRYGQLGDGTSVDRSTPVQITPACQILLPIELLSFNAYKEHNRVRLAWSTASETNNSYFTIEKLLNGIDWEPIGVVAGAGNSTQTINYESFDESPVPGIQYYKLKQTDFDGKYQYSKPIAINYNQNFSFSIYPNPATINSGSPIYLNLSSSNSTNKSIVVVVYDALGREAVSKIIIEEKNNTGTIIAIDPSNTLLPGTYIVTATSDNSIYREKLVITTNGN